MSASATRPLRVLAFLEAASVTGPAKNLLDFGTYGRRLPDSPVELVLATYRRPSDPETDPYLTEVKRRNLECHVLPESGPYDPSAIGRVREVVQSVKPDVVQTHNVKSHLFFWASRLASRFPWVAWQHGYTRPTWIQRCYNEADRFSLRHAQRVITVTQAFVPALRHYGVRQDRIRIVANAIDPSWLEIPEQPLRLNRDCLRMLAIGRLSHEKAHADLIEAVAVLQRASGQPCKVTILGEGPEEQRLRALAEQKGVTLQLPGLLTDVRPYLAEADVFVLPSLSEGSPNVLIEAMAAGIPIVASNVGGVPETVQGGRDALLVPPGNPKNLVEAIQQLRSHPQQALEMAEAARSRVRDEFLPDARVRRIIRVYREILPGSAAVPPH